MSDEQIEELLRLTKENNALLQRIVEHVDSINAEDYKTKHLLQEFTNNVVADLFADALLQPKGRGHVTSDDIMRFINEMKAL